jgi:hypothetical protein
MWWNAKQVNLKAFGAFLMMSGAASILRISQKIRTSVRAKTAFSETAQYAVERRF